MSNRTPTYLDAFLNRGVLDNAGNVLPRRSNLRILGGATVQDNESLDSTDFTLPSVAGGSGQANLSLTTGLNSNVATDGSILQRIGGPGGPYSIGGIIPSAGVFAGKPLIVSDTTGQPFAIAHEDAASSPAYRIRTPNGQTYSVGATGGSSSVILYYDSNLARFVLIATGPQLERSRNPREFGAKGDGINDDTAAIQAAINAAGIGGHVLLTFPGSYRITGPITIAQPCTVEMQKGASFVPNAPDGVPSATTKFFLVSSSDVILDGLSCDYSGHATLTENTRYLIWAAGANVSTHIARVRIRNCNLTNFMVGAFVPPSSSSPSLNVGHGIFCTWVDELVVEHNFVDNVSGFGIFVEGCNHPTIRGNAVQDTGWAGIIVNSGGFGGLIENNRLLSTLGASGHRFDEGGMLGVPGTPSDGMGGNYRLIIRGNYLTGYVEYGEGIRCASSSYMDIDSNILDNIYGTSVASPDAYITLDTRGGQTDATQQVRIRGNLFIAPAITNLYQGASGRGIAGIYAQNVLSGAGSGRSIGLLIADNQFLSPGTGSFFTTAIAVHGQSGGWDDITIHDNIGAGWCMANANVAGFCVVEAGTASTATNIRIHDNTFTRLSAMPNDGNQIGINLGQNALRAIVDHNTVDSWTVPILTTGATGTDIRIHADPFGATNFIDTGDAAFEIRRLLGTRTAAFGSDGKVLIDSLTVSAAVVTDASKKLASLAYSTSATASAIVQRDSSGNGTFVGVICSGDAVYLDNTKPIYMQDNGGTYRKILRASGNFTDLAGAGSGIRFNSIDMTTVVASLDESGNLAVAGTIAPLSGALQIKSVGGDVKVQLDNTGLGFFGASTVARPTVTGAKLPSDTVMASLLAALASLGLITDSTT